MKRLLQILAMFFVLASPPVALAQSHQDGIVSALREQGYDEIEIRRTLLGRVRIQAYREDGRREIVINSQSGLILRDHIFRQNSRNSGFLGNRRLDDDADDRDNSQDTTTDGGGATSGAGGTKPESSPAIPAVDDSSDSTESDTEEINGQSETQTESNEF